MKVGIQTRLLLLTTLVLGSCLALAGFVLDRSFKASIVAGAQEQLRLVVYSLLGAAEQTQGSLGFGLELPEPRLEQPESGLYASVADATGSQIWVSPSAQTSEYAFPNYADNILPGEFHFRTLEAVTETTVESESNASYVLSYAVIWEDDEESMLVFSVAADRSPFQSAINGFRRNLTFGLGAVVALFGLAQFLAVRWGLAPLRVMAEEVVEMERGDRAELSEAYPQELHGLAQNLTHFVDHEKRSRSRYRKAMEDLAHSLKTPLAVVRNALSDRQPLDRPLLEEQLQRMESTVGYQLSRASVTGPVALGQSVALAELVNRLVRALQTAYAERHIDVEVHIAEDLRVRGDERDLLEIFGNLIENAFKYTHSRIRISATGFSEVTSVVVGDDGPGIKPALREDVVNRGTRADQIQSGQGIGLAMAAELIQLYTGSLAIGESELGGAKLIVELPR